MPNSVCDPLKVADKLSRDWFTKHALCDIHTRYVRAYRRVFVRDSHRLDLLIPLRCGEFSKSPSDSHFAWTDDSLALFLSHCYYWVMQNTAGFDLITPVESYGHKILARGPLAHELWLRGWSFQEVL